MELTPEERIFLLEDAIVQAQHTVSFLHNCLVNPDNGQMKGGYHYAYPEQTLRHLKEWSELVSLPPSCHHSYQEPGCESCRLSHEHRMRLYSIRGKLGGNMICTCGHALYYHYPKPDGPCSICSCSKYQERKP